MDSSFKSVVATSPHDTLIFCDPFPFRYLTSDYGLHYAAAYHSCPVPGGNDWEPSEETLRMLSDALTKNGGHAVLVLEKSDRKTAKSVILEAKMPSCDTFTLDSMQTTALRDAFNGKTYLRTMRDNLGAIKKALE